MTAASAQRPGDGEALATGDGGDGPSAFCLDLCARYEAVPPGPGWDRVLTFESK